MKSPREIEVKLKVDNPRALKRRLTEAGFGVVVRRHFEGNVVYDFRDSRLRRSRSLLRLRTEENRYILTFKSPLHASQNYKIRTELETVIKDAATMERILGVLGLRPIFRYEKYRTAYAEKDQPGPKGKALLVYDETPIGFYIELEGPARWIDRTAHRLGFGKRDYITASYAELYQNYCRLEGIKAGNMVFSGHKS
jgi:adenylate cyclase, class 2